MNGPTDSMHKRLMFIVTFLLSLLCILVPIQIGYKQIIQHDKYESLAVSQQTRDKIISADRGTIYDTNMKELAVSATVEQISVDPQIIKEEQRELVSQKLSEILEVEYDYVYERVIKNTQYETIKRRVEKVDADLVRAFVEEENVPGIVISPDTKRYYPQGNLASNLIGFTGTDGTGLEGIEGFYNDTLSGTPGRIVSARDAKGNEMPFDYEQLIEPQNGNSIVLTIDEVIQYFLEKHLETARIDTGALEGVGGIIMDVKTGEILAMATKPDYDLNNPFEITDEMLLSVLEGIEDEEEYTETRRTVLQQMWRNKPVVDSYEPGSTFKIFTMSMAYEEGLVNANTSFNCPGYKIVAGTRISCWKAGGHGTQSLVQTLENSCNPGMMDMGSLLGTTAFKRYYELFGFLQKTNIDLPGETNGLFFSEGNFNQVELAVSSFGQTFQITPLQLITGVSAIVNDGNMVKPHVIKEVLDADGKIISATSTEPVRQVVSAETSAFMRNAMESVVATGTASNAYVKGYRVGGKTATSQKRSKEIETGGNHYIASFIGVAPMDDPQIAVLVMIDEPQGYLHQGGQIAAPVVGRIMADVLPYIGVEPQYTETEIASIDIVTPNLIGLSETGVKDALSGQNLSYRLVGSGENVTDQVPAPGVKVPSSATMILYMGETKPSENVTVPNVIGKTASEAKAILERNGLYMRATGSSALISSVVSAKASTQSPKAQQVVSLGTIVNVEFVDTQNVSD